MLRNGFQEEGAVKDSRLHAVFSKLTGVRPRAEDLADNTNPKTMSSDIIESVLADTPVPVPQNWNYDYGSPAGEEPDSSLSISDLSDRLEAELRSAKRTHLSCGEVLLPCGLLQRISRDILSMAESEPCGLRGCRLYLQFESEEQCARLGTVQCDSATASTFELYLTLKQASTGWGFLPHFLRNLTRGGTVVLSPAYVLSKKKLYRAE